MDNHLHIVSFNVPWPADYGGVIDVYQRIVALSKCGVKIHLHCFEYGREASDELGRWCEEVCYYHRDTGFFRQLERRPYIVASRCSKQLVQRLEKDNYPILLEGLHDCSVLEHFGSRRHITVRAHNVEHDYYQALSKAEQCVWKRLFFSIEAFKLRRYEPILVKASAVLAISQQDADHFRAIGCKNVFLLPPSHGHQEVKSQHGRGDYVLYHGNLSVAENETAARYLMEQVVPNSPYQFVIAGRSPSDTLRKEAEKHDNVRLVADPDDAEMHKLLQEAQVNLLITHQPTGVKLKLMNALYEGRHCLVNSTMVQGTRLEEACRIADTPESLCRALDEMMVSDFTENERQKRIEILRKNDSIEDFINIIL